MKLLINFLHFPVTTALLDPNIPLCTFLSRTVNLSAALLLPEQSHRLHKWVWSAIYALTFTYVTTDEMWNKYGTEEEHFYTPVA